MNYVLRSRMYREELLRWALIIALFCWAVVATAVAATTKSQILVIGVSDNESYLISEVNAAHEQKEVVAFLQKFIGRYYGFDEKTFGESISGAGDMMSEDLWALKQPEIQKLATNLKVDPLSQSVSILSLDKIDEGKFEALIRLEIRRKLDVAKVDVRVSMKIEKRERNAQNVWPYELVEVSDAVL
ncbi:MAG: hypothetical protein EOP06_08670 [Proteobacteria bacterium]|nr:MAG: hypothetical protein EOP06_08670 [Pseudomonadota bacterium]